MLFFVVRLGLIATIPVASHKKTKLIHDDPENKHEDLALTLEKGSVLRPGCARCPSRSEPGPPGKMPGHVLEQF